MRTTTRERGVTLRLVDLSEVEDEATQQWAAEKADGSWLEVGFAPYAAAEHNGDLYVVNVEGVGCKVTDEHPLLVDLYRKSDSGFGILPVMEASLTPLEVRARMRADIDLADLIREFGQRLEDNFAIWHYTLTKDGE